MTVEDASALPYEVAKPIVSNPQNLPMVANEIMDKKLEITPYPTTTGAASWMRQSWIMLRRNWTLYILRYWKSTLAQVLIAPIIFLFLLWILQQLNNRQQLRSRRHPLSYPLTGLPDCQGPEFGQPCVNLLYTPDTPEVRSILTLFAQEQQALTKSPNWGFSTMSLSGPPTQISGMVPVPDVNSIYNYVLQNPNYTNWGVAFDIVQSQTPVGIGANYRYQIWMNASQYGNGSELFGVYPLTMASMMDQAIMSYANNAPVGITVTLKDWPRIPPSFTYDAIVQSLGTVFFFCAAMVIFLNILNTIVSEKEQRLRSAMEMMGLHPSVYWFTYFITYALESLVASLITCCFGLAFGFEAFRNTNFGVTFITFFLFGLAMNSFAFFITCCVKTSRVAVLVGIFMFIIGLLFESFIFSNQFIGYVWWEPNTVNPAGWIVLMFLPFFNFGAMFLDITTLATGKPDFQTDTYIPGPGFTWADLYKPIPKEYLPYYGNGLQPQVPPPVYNWYFLIMNIGFYLILTFYLDNVVPDEFGQKQPPWFFLLPSYWGLDTASRAAKASRTGLVTTDDLGAFTPTAKEMDSSATWLEHVKQEGQSLGYLDQIPPDQDEDVTIEARNALDPNYTQPIQGRDHVQQPPAVRIVGLRKVYKNSMFKKDKDDKIAVKNTNLTMQEGVLLALLGQNGAGKSTTINILSGLTPATSGDALIYNLSVRDQMPFIRSMMGICPQHDILFADLTAQEHMQLYAGLKGIPDKDLPQLMEERLSAVRLWNVKDQRAGTYSGGMKRRLSMVISTVGDPKIIFLDEPTTGLDPVARRYTWAFIEQFKKNRVIVLTTHSMEEADVLGDRIAIMAHGRLRALGSSIRLKNKYGAGYRITIVTNPDPANVARAKEILGNGILKNATLEDDSAGAFIYNLSRDRIAEIPEIVKYLDANPDGLVNTYGISQTSLEEVFLHLIREAEHRDPNVAGGDLK